MKRQVDAWLYGAAVSTIFVVGLTFLFLGARKYPELLGLGLLSFTLGVRHAFDADHISAIDNMARKLVQQKKNPKGVGFFFACGHSTIVISMTVVAILAVKWAQAVFPQFQKSGGTITGAVSGAFLLVFALINFIILRDVVLSFQRLRQGRKTANTVDFTAKGRISRAINFLFNLVNKNWHVFLVGILFGLGFDTATQLAVLATSAGAANEAIPLLSILSFPILFTAGMSLMDTLDGFFMTTAYQWALNSPLKKVYFNLVITGLSVLAAGLFGTVKIAQVILQEIGIREGLGFWLQNLDF